MKTFPLIIISIVMSCASGNTSDKTESGLDPADFRQEVNGRQTDLFTLKNANGMEACITNYGARLVSLVVPDKNGRGQDVVCGFDSIADYIRYPQNYGATMGRYIGRILNARFTLDDKEYQLNVNNMNRHCMHGGAHGFATQMWDVTVSNDSTLTLKYLSLDGEEGFPGNLEVSITYALTGNNELDISYAATTDKATVINMGHHSFFNLSGDFNQTITDHILYVNGTHYTPIDTLWQVTGQIEPVKNTPLDFTFAHAIGDSIHHYQFAQLKTVGGYDHTWVLDTKGDTACLAASLLDPESGRKMKVYTNEPGMQIYTGNSLNGKVKGKKGIAYAPYSAVCMESMHYHDSPNKPQFPSTFLRPGENYHSFCRYKFEW